MYSYIGKKRKKKIHVLNVCIFFIFLMALLLLLREQQGIGKMMKQELANYFYEELIEFYMPWMTYQPAKEGKEVLFEEIWCQVFPWLEYVEENEYETEIESAISYEMILALEAADENYVNETGEVVIQSDISDAEVDNSKEKTAVDDGKLEEAVISQNTSEGEKEAQEQPDAKKDGTEDKAENKVENSASAEVEQVAAMPEKMVTYPVEKLADFDYLIQNFYQVDRTTTIDGSQLNAEAMLQKDMTLSHDASTPQILIYHTHSQEGYADSVPGDAATSVVGVGEYLTKLLTEEYGLNVIHHTGQYDVEDRDHAYSLAGPALEQVLAENPSIEVVIDLHRDGVREDTHLVTEVDGRPTAKIMFFNGLSRTTSMGDIAYLENPNIADNLAFSFQMQLKAAEYYPDLTRRIYLKGYRYNMHYCPKTLLVEVGAQTNTVEEAMNAMIPLAGLLNQVLNEKT